MYCALKKNVISIHIEFYEIKNKITYLREHLCKLLSIETDNIPS